MRNRSLAAAWSAVALLVHFLGVASGYPVTANFEDLPLLPGSYWDGTDSIGPKTFQSHGVSFHNTSTDWGGGFMTWEGFAYSNINDTTTSGYTNQYAVWTPGTGRGGSGNYAVAYRGFDRPRLTLPEPAIVQRIWVNNTTYAALSMLNGDMFAKKFGGTSGTDPDWFLLKIYGLDANNNTVGYTEFYLADYRFADSADDYIIGEWTPINLSAFGLVKHLEFDLESSDVGAWGMNTPAYFALEDVEVIPEPWTAGIALVGVGVLRLVRRTRR